MSERNRASGAVAVGAAMIIGLVSGLPSAQADELADLRANQELLQRRIDQLAQGQQAQQPPPAGPGQPVVGGSFPRSFLIPGTDTSLRIGGFANASVLWYIHGAAPDGQLDGQGSNNTTYTDGQGGTGNLAGIPLNNSIARDRSNAFIISGKYSRFLVDARTPTAWGEAKAYLEMDFSYNNTNVIQSAAEGVSSSFLPRLRKAYGTLGGLLAGQDT